MFVSRIQLQIVSCIILGVILLLFSNNRKLKLHSSNIYRVFVVLSFVNILADIATVYTITHMDTVPPLVNRLAHALFIVTLDALTYCLYLYVLSLSHKRESISPILRCAMAMPISISSFMAVFGQLYYYFDGVSAYSYGPAVDALYACIAFYILASNVVAVMHRKIISKRVSIALQASTLIWGIAALIQLYHPELLISNVAVMLMVLYTYFSLENPHSYIDQETGCFNRRAMVQVIDEKLAKGENFSIVNISVINLRELCHMRGYSAMARVLQEMSECCKTLFQTDVYRYHNSAFMLMTSFTGTALTSRCGDLFIRLQRPFCDEQSIRVEGGIDVLKEERVPDNCHDILETLDYLLEHSGERFCRSVHVVDDKLLAAKKRVETIRQMLEKAVAEDGFSVVYQPIYDTRTQSFSSVEALVRLKDTQTIGFVPPDEFITVAERSGTIAQLGEIVLEKVCAMASSSQL